MKILFLLSNLPISSLHHPRVNPSFTSFKSLFSDIKYNTNEEKKGRMRILRLNGNSKTAMTIRNDGRNDMCNKVCNNHDTKIHPCVIEPHRVPIMLHKQINNPFALRTRPFGEKKTSPPRRQFHFKTTQFPLISNQQDSKKLDNFDVFCNASWKTDPIW